MTTLDVIITWRNGGLLMVVGLILVLILVDYFLYRRSK